MAACGDPDGSRLTLAPKHPSVPSGGTCRSSAVTCACVASVGADRKQDKQSVGMRAEVDTHTCAAVHGLGTGLEAAGP